MRKQAENGIIAEIYSMIDNDPSLVHGRVILPLRQGLDHHGVIGIVASRIMETVRKALLHCFRQPAARFAVQRVLLVNFPFLKL